MGWEGINYFNSLHPLVLRKHGFLWNADKSRFFWWGTRLKHSELLMLVTNN